MNYKFHLHFHKAVIGNLFPNELQYSLILSRVSAFNPLSLNSLMDSWSLKLLSNKRLPLLSIYIHIYHQYSIPNLFNRLKNLLFPLNSKLYIYGQVRQNLCPGSSLLKHPLDNGPLNISWICQLIRLL